MNIQSTNPILTIPQSQALLNVAHLAFESEYAANCALQLLGGNSSEDLRKGIAGLGLTGAAFMCSDNVIVMLETLKAAGVCADKNLRPSDIQRLVTYILAGFDSNSERALKLANGESERLAAAGIIIPENHWGLPFSPNGLRRTAATVHYRLFGSTGHTAEWAGYSKLSFPILGSHRHLVTRSEARQFWTMLPTQLQPAGIKVSSPANHEQDPSKVASLVSLLEQGAKAQTSDSPSH